MIRENPYACWDYLPNCVRKYYTKKVCVIGTESCGKSTLVRQFAQNEYKSFVLFDFSKVSKEEKTLITQAFLELVELEGYTPMIYGKKE